MQSGVYTYTSAMSRENLPKKIISILKYILIPRFFIIFNFPARLTNNTNTICCFFYKILIKIFIQKFHSLMLKLHLLKSFINYIVVEIKIYSTSRPIWVL